MNHLEPKIVWSFFDEITQIPRPSKKEEKIRAYLQHFAEINHLRSNTDKAGNVLISKAATFGNEDKDTLILQAHMDMVCEKNTGVEHNFDTDPIQTTIDGDWLKAQGTTLGADNGIGMAMMLAILASDNIKHPPLECLFTTDEETGLTGAFALGKDFLTGTTLINLDSEDDGKIFVGCAGGIDTTAVYKYKTEKTPNDFFAFSVTISGLKGGHSGDDINKGYGNANKLLNRILWNIYKETDLLLVSIDGGNLHNAIPREASAVCCVPFEDKEEVRIIFNHTVSELEQEFINAETSMRAELHSENIPEYTMSKKSTTKIIEAVYACPHGVKKMSDDMPGLVETSTNLASIKMKSKKKLKIVTSQRSSVESAKHDIKNQVETVFRLMGAKVTHGDGYPGWKPNLSSKILKNASESYFRLNGKNAQIKAIHAGLECGLFLEKYPYLDMISIGPEMQGVHSPDERLSIQSTQDTWKWLVNILEQL